MHARALELLSTVPRNTIPYYDAQFEMGKIYFSKIFKRFKGNITKIAEFAGTSRKTVYRFIEKHNLHT